MTKTSTVPQYKHIIYIYISYIIPMYIYIYILYYIQINAGFSIVGLPEGTN